MPGVDKEGVGINVKDDQLTINGKVTLPAEGETTIHKEYEVGNYFRQFTCLMLSIRKRLPQKWLMAF